MFNKEEILLRIHDLQLQLQQLDKLQKELNYLEDILYSYQDGTTTILQHLAEGWLDDG